MQNNIKEAFNTLIEIGNIGKKDIERLQIILTILDNDGKVSKEKAIAQTHPKSANPERSYDNFVNRIKKEIKETYIDIDNEDYKEILSSMSIAHSNLLGKSYLILKGKPIQKLQPTTSENKTYAEEYYVNASGDTSRKKEIFISYATVNEGEKERFVTHLKSVLDKKKIVYHLDLWEMKDIPIGISFDKEIKKHLKKADYGFVLLSNNVMQSNYILNIELPHLLEHNKVFPIGLVGDIDGLNSTIDNIENSEHKDTAKALMARNIQLSLERTFFDKCANDTRREEFIENVIYSLEHRMEFDKQDEEIIINNVVLNKQGYEKDNFYDVHKGERTKVTLNTDKVNHKNTTLSVKIQDDLQQWFNNEKMALYALLGDYGMGKTFNLRMFSHRLYDTYLQNKKNPFPFYIDLRDVESFVTTVDGIKRVRNIDEFITEILRQSKNTHLSADEILQMHRNGSLILILDGLDEKLVHYNKEEQKTFFREIVSVMTYDKDTQYASKTILSCRNHYFETTASQNNFLLGADRTNLKSDDYTALNILPLESDEMLAFLKKRITDEEAERIMLYVNDDEYLGSIASRPFMLGKIIDLLPQLTQLKAQQKSINTATFYAALIKDTLGRDVEKHFIAERHKHTILKALSYYMFENNTQSLSVDRLNDWFEDFIHNTPKLARYYNLRDDRHILEKDLRNSSLLVRFGAEDFGFSHSSIAEYFLAQYILEHYDMASKGKEVTTLTYTMIVESTEGLSKKIKEALLPKLIYRAESNDQYWAKLSLELLCKLQLPIESLTLNNLNLCNFKLENLTINKFFLKRCNLFSVSWKQCHIDLLNSINTNLNENYFSHTRIIQFLDANNGLYSTTSYKSNINMVIAFNYDSYRSNSFPTVLRKKDTYWITSVAYSPDNKTILSASHDKTIRLWDIASGKCIQTFKGHRTHVSSVIYSPNGKTILSGSRDKTLRLWDTQSAKCLLTLEGHHDYISSVAYSPDGKTLLSGSQDKSLKLWDSKSGKCLLTIEGHSNWITSVCYSPNGKTILSASDDKTIRLWELKSGNCLQIFKGHSGYIRSVAFGPDSKTILSASDDKTIRLWDTKSGKCLQVIKGHTDFIRSVIYSPDGRTILSGSNDRTLRLWDVKSGKCILTINAHDKPITSISYSKNMKTLLSGSDDGTVRIFDANTGIPIMQMITFNNQWCSINYIDKTAKGTPMSWKYVSLEDNGEKYYFSDMKGFEVCE